MKVSSLASASFFLLFGYSALVRAQQDVGSQAYILSHFHYSEVARVSMIQQKAFPSGPRVRPCSAHVFPSSPGQSTKNYYVDALITYSDSGKIHTEGQKPPKLPTQNKEGISTHQNMCRMENKNNPNRNPQTGTRWCVTIRVGRFLIMSDVYHDTCGNYFRGVWESATVMDSYVHGKPQYTSMEEHSVTTSLGRFDGMEKDPQFSGAFNSIPGPTGAVPAERFLFFVTANPQDMEEVDKVLRRMLSPAGSYLRCKDGTFSMERRHCVE